MFRFQEARWHDRVPSTQTLLRQRVLTGEVRDGGAVEATLTQTAGRGRYERVWTSAPGRDLAFSFTVAASFPLEQLPSLPMACALGVVGFLQELGLRDVQSKWPNDVHCRRHKIAGILAERVDPPKRTPLVIIGLGLNVNMSRDEAGAIDQPATSVCVELGRTFEVKELLPRLQKELSTWITRWQHGGFAALRPTWERLCAYQGETVTVRDGDLHHEGRLAGFGPFGELLLDEDGETRAVWSGDLSPGTTAREV